MGTLTRQLINLLAAILLLISFAMLSQRRVLSLIRLFAWQGLVLVLSTTIVAWSTGQAHPDYCAALTLAPRVVEFGVALDVLVGTFIFGIFFFQIRETFDSLDIHHLEKLKED